jgi:imidazolonepropionase-like amidohydrolase
MTEGERMTNTRTILQPTWVIDGTGAPALRDHAVILADGLIDSVIPAASLTTSDADTIVDLPGATLLPGLINNHVHLVLPGDNTPFTPWIDLQTDATLALWAAHNALVSLHSGVTTVRDCGGRGTIVIDTRDAQAAGRVHGARIISCGWTLTITGGHTRHFGGEADGPDALRAMVRKAVSKGADFVKVMASGGGTPGSFSQYPSFSREELRAICETAHSLGKTVTAHCIATESLSNAVEVGVDFIEHASFYGTDLVPHYEPRVAERLAASGIPVTPTLQVARDAVDTFPEGPDLDIWKERRDSHHGIIRNLREMGVPILAGSDAGWRATPFDTFWKEIDELTMCGLSNVEAISAATGATSKALGRDDQFGTIQPGRIADLLAVTGDASTDMQALSRVEAVYQGGQRVVDMAG